jgi:Ca-activated chloride channel family protein
MLLLGLLASSCALGGGPMADDDPEEAAAACTPADCIVVDVAVSPEKASLIVELAKAFNSSDERVGGRRIVVRPRERASGAVADRLTAGWGDDPDDPRPVLWAPAARSWGAIVDERLAVRGRPPMAGTPTPTMASPLVIAMPRRMAEALGHPHREIGWSDLAALASDPTGWASRGHPEWGAFRLGKTDPRYSTSGLHAWIAQHAAATGTPPGGDARPRPLSSADLDTPAATALNRAIESSVVHYGDTTLTFLDNWRRADQRGNPYQYASAVIVDEKAVIDYNSGDPDGVQDPGEVIRRPRDPLVAIYPREGTVVSDNPFYVLDADWVSPAERDAARAFIEFVLRPESQHQVVQAGFRTARAAESGGTDPNAVTGPPLTGELGVDPDQPRTALELPTGPVLTQLLDRWVPQHKAARVMLVVDVSGSMADEAAAGQSKLALAQAAIEQSLDHFRDHDLLGVRQFSTGLGPTRDQQHLDLAPVAPLGGQRDVIRRGTAALVPANGTPLYTAARDSVGQMVARYDASRINAVVLLTDGRNEDGETADDKRQRDELVRFLQAQTQGENGRPVRLFTIGYGASADAAVLKEMAEATNGRYYSATSDPTTIAEVFLQVVSNF